PRGPAAVGRPTHNARGARRDQEQAQLTQACTAAAGSAAAKGRMRPGSRGQARYAAATTQPVGRQRGAGQAAAGAAFAEQRRRRQRVADAGRSGRGDAVDGAADAGAGPGTHEARAGVAVVGRVNSHGGNPGARGIGRGEQPSAGRRPHVRHAREPRAARAAVAAVQLRPVYSGA
ncbi:hypothetical protein LPJ70_007331, partial [Coemansia sp. RSA 2708]